jgi:monoamine oxidase
MSTLLDLDLWNDIAFEENITQQATMFQPIGGMDQIPRALGKKLGNAVKQMAEVQEIRRTDKGVRIVYLDRKTGQTQQITADYCISTIPLPVLAKIPADFSPEIKTGLNTISSGNSMKIAFQSRRFWEQDYNIYGGLSFSKSPAALIWQPSTGYHRKEGVIIFFGGVAEVGKRGLPEQYEMARGAIDGVYPGHGKELTKPVSVQWQKTPYNLGTGARFNDENRWLYTKLNEGEPPFFFANDYLAHIGSWQEGAILSAYHAISAIDTHHRQAKL